MWSIFGQMYRELRIKRNIICPRLLASAPFGVATVEAMRLSLEGPKVRAYSTRKEGILCHYSFVGDLWHTSWTSVHDESG